MLFGLLSVLFMLFGFVYMLWQYSFVYKLRFETVFLCVIFSIAFTFLTVSV